jgi:hypothetical protein
MTMTDRLGNNLLKLFDAYCDWTGESVVTHGVRSSGDGKLYNRLREGGGTFQVYTYDRVVAYFVSIWPEDLQWPRGVDKVDPSKVEKRPRKPRSPKAQPQEN